jgi:hypothetical protein
VEYPASVAYTVVRSTESGPQHPSITTQFRPSTGAVTPTASTAAMFTVERLNRRSPMVTR